jgi:hypothetical protein
MAVPEGPASLGQREERLSFFDDIGGEFRRGRLQACSDLTLGF